VIGTLRGALAAKSPAHVIVEAGGVGYQVIVPLSTLSELPPEGTAVFLHIHTHVREDALQLYGFADEGQKRVFMTLLGISGIGPRLALNIVSSIPHEEFLRAVEAEDVERLSRVPGLGKKSSHRIILELRGKLPTLGGPREDRDAGDAVSALVNLGYRKTDAQKAVERARAAGHEDIETMLREALKYLSAGRDEKG
jgi:Holliday junction DNA helicase RuvA